MLLLHLTTYLNISSLKFQISMLIGQGDLFVAV